MAPDGTSRLFGRGPARVLRLEERPVENLQDGRNPATLASSFGGLYAFGQGAAGRKSLIFRKSQDGGEALPVSGDPEDSRAGHPFSFRATARAGAKALLVSGDLKILKPDRERA